MNSIFSSVGINVLYVLMLQPFASLQILSFRNFLSREAKERIAVLWGVLVVAEIAGLTAVTVLHPFASGQIEYLLLGYLVWVPQFVLCFYYTRKFWIGHLFVISFRILLSGIIYTVSRAVCQYLYPDTALSRLYVQQILVYGVLSLLFFPFLLHFLDKVFSHFREAAARQYWRYITVIPFLLAVESLYLSLFDSLEMVFDLLVPRLILLVAVILTMASIRSAQKEVYEELQAYEDEHELQQQYTSAKHYVDMAKESKKRLDVIYQEKREHLDKLQALVERRDKAGVLEYLEKLGEKFNTTKLPQYCQNTVINAALTVYLSKARELDIPVTIQADLPQGLNCSVDLSIVLSNLVENALIASQKQPEEKRNITVLALHQGDMLNILVKNLFDAPVELGENGLPVTHVKGHGIGMKSLARFRDKYGASVLCQQKGGWFLTYLQVSAQAKGIGD